ncbi:hypothetical protein [Sagittula salina]|uniref:Uncharacterized protein n=1 Tax=Sagittula salina TaxID=2820268 RepID=A0A940MLP5_9RHOB|nr:hypothetical protein [Sagittula salina]MBP0484135.1 hypothetical protein [Sagittula salina]
MPLFRVIFLTLSGLAIGGTTYAAWYGYGGTSTDVSKSIREGSNGRSAIAGRIK